MRHMDRDDSDQDSFTDVITMHDNKVADRSTSILIINVIWIIIMTE